jgi:hypothetical protein
MGLFMVKFVEGKTIETGLNPFFVGLRKSEIAMDRRPDRGCGLDRSIIFPVLIGYGPVQSQYFSSLETGPSNTRKPQCLDPSR